MGKSLIGTIIALSPWAVLVALVSAELLRGSGSGSSPKHSICIPFCTGVPGWDKIESCSPKKECVECLGWSG